MIDDVYDLATCQFITYPAGDNTSTSENALDGSASSATETTGTTGATPEAGQMQVHDSKRCNHNEEAQRVSLQKNIAFIWKTMVKSKKDWRILILCLLGIPLLEAPIIIGTVAWPQFRLPMELSVVLQLILGVVYAWATLKGLPMLGRIRVSFAETTHEKIATWIMT